MWEASVFGVGDLLLNLFIKRPLGKSVAAQPSEWASCW